MPTYLELQSDRPVYPLLPASVSETGLRFPNYEYVKNGRPGLIKVGDEVLRVRALSVGTLPPVTVPGPVAAGDTVLTLSSTDGVYADPARGLTMTVNLRPPGAQPGDPGVEQLTITEILSATDVAVTRPAPVAVAAGGSVEDAQSTERWQVARGDNGTIPAAVPRNALAVGLVVAEDFVTDKAYTAGVQSLKIDVIYPPLSNGDRLANAISARLGPSESDAEHMFMRASGLVFAPAGSMLHPYIGWDSVLLAAGATGGGFSFQARRVADAAGVPTPYTAENAWFGNGAFDQDGTFLMGAQHVDFNGLLINGLISPANANFANNAAEFGVDVLLGGAYSVVVRIHRSPLAT